MRQAKDPLLLQASVYEQLVTINDLLRSVALGRDAPDPDEQKRPAQQHNIAAETCTGLRQENAALAARQTELLTLNERLTQQVKCLQQASADKELRLALQVQNLTRASADRESLFVAKSGLAERVDELARRLREREEAHTRSEQQRSALAADLSTVESQHEALRRRLQQEVDTNVQLAGQGLRWQQEIAELRAELHDTVERADRAKGTAEAAAALADRRSQEAQLASELAASQCREWQAKYEELAAREAKAGVRAQRGEWPELAALRVEIERLGAANAQLQGLINRLSPARPAALLPTGGWAGLTDGTRRRADPFVPSG